MYNNLLIVHYIVHLYLSKIHKYLVLCYMCNLVYCHTVRDKFQLYYIVLYCNESFFVPLPYMKA